MRLRLLAAAFFVAFIAFGVNVECAGAPTTYVATYGSDANSCSLALPCRSFKGALAQTSTGGEIVVLDSGGYGPVQIDKSVAIVAPDGVYAGVSVFTDVGITIVSPAARVRLSGLTIVALGHNFGISSSAAADVSITQSIAVIGPRAVHAGIAVASAAGIVINAPGKTVRLEGISLEAAGGAVGVRVDDAELVLIERCTITGFSDAGIKATAAASKIFVHDTTIRDSGVGIYIDGATKTVVDHSRLEKNSGAGMRVGSDSLVTIANSVIALNGTHGVLIQPTAGTARTAIAGTSIVENGGDGVHASAAAASIVTLSLSTSELRRNASGLAADAVAGATIGMDVEDSALSDHANAGISTSNAGGTVKVTISGNTLTRNGTGVVNIGALIESRGNNTFNYNGANGGPFTALPGV